MGGGRPVAKQMKKKTLEEWRMKKSSWEKNAFCGGEECFLSISFSDTPCHGRGIKCMHMRCPLHSHKNMWQIVYCLKICFVGMENLRECTNEEMFAFIAQSVYFSLGCVADMNRFLFGIESSRCSDDERSMACKLRGLYCGQTCTQDHTAFISYSYPFWLFVYFIYFTLNHFQLKSLLMKLSLRLRLTIILQALLLSTWHMGIGLGPNSSG